MLGGEKTNPNSYFRGGGVINLPNMLCSIDLALKIFIWELLVELMSNVINTTLQYRKFSIQTYIKNESIQKLSLKLCNKGLMNKSR